MIPGLAGTTSQSNSPNKSIRSQIENASQYPEGYAERAKLVYKTAEKEKWTQEQTLEMLKDPLKFSRFIEIVSLSLCVIINYFVRNNFRILQI